MIPTRYRVIDRDTELADLPPTEKLVRAALEGDSAAPRARAARSRVTMPSTSSSRRWACSRCLRALACSPNVSA